MEQIDLAGEIQTKLDEIRQKLGAQSIYKPDLMDHKGNLGGLKIWYDSGLGINAFVDIPCSDHLRIDEIQIVGKQIILASLWTERIQFIKKRRIDRIGISTFSMEDQTLSWRGISVEATYYKDEVKPRKIKQTGDIDNEVIIKDERFKQSFFQRVGYLLQFVEVNL